MWSIKSGKTILLWNGQNLTRMFPGQMEHRLPPSIVEFTWHADTGEKFEVVARKAPIESMNQYDLLINGVSFFMLPSLRGMQTEYQDPVSVHEKEHPFAFSSEHDFKSTTPTLLPPDESADIAHIGVRTLTEVSRATIQGMKNTIQKSKSTIEQQNRLEAAGFGFKKFTFDLGGLEDELRSDLYSSKLDVLRDEVAASIPETEGMMSKAIVNAFSEDHNSDRSHDSSFAENAIDTTEQEICILAETFEWLKLSYQTISKYDIHDSKLELMEKHVATIVTHVRHDRMSPHAASEILLRVASVLELDVSRNLTHDTVIVIGLSSMTTTQDLREAMIPFGNISSVAVCKTYKGYGLCRFVSVTPAERACESACRNEIDVLSRKLQVFALLCVPVSNYGETIASNMKVSPELTYSLDDDDEQAFHHQHIIDSSDYAIETTYLHSQSHRSLTSSCTGQSLMEKDDFDSAITIDVNHDPFYRHSSRSTFNTLPTLNVDNMRPVGTR